MIAIRIEDLLIEQVDLLAKTKHMNRSSIIREAIVRYLEDNEDLALALEVMKKKNPTKTLAQVKAEFDELDRSDR
jgi:RHH-type rel operon transcriptional repressor/antitoxin RelB